MSVGTRRDFLRTTLRLAGAVLAPTGLRGRTDAEDEPAYLGLLRSGLLKTRVEQLRSRYESCSLCPRDCRVDRTKGETGRCRAGAALRISSAFPHFGEERPLSGRKGSGTIFFSHCGLRCVFCQNYQISIEGEGVDITEERLAESMLKLQGMGCHNINLVTPTHFLPGITAALEMAAANGLRIPLVYNTSGYENPEVLRLLEDIVDIYLPDFKYWNPGHAAVYSSDAYSYPHYAKSALKEMYRQVGDLKRAGRGIARRGLMVRHLVLPNRIAGTREILGFIARELSKNTYVNIMRQYRPEHRAREFPDIARRLTRSEYREALVWAEEYGLTNLDRR